jgi:hypothetical protein
MSGVGLIRYPAEPAASLAVSASPESGSKFQALALPRTAEIEKWWPIVKAANIKAE